MKLNCDMGEGFDEIDQNIMPYIDMASIACGGHAGDGHSMRTTIELALSHGVNIGAHPSYPDIEHFGRRSLSISTNDLLASICQQLDALMLQASKLNAEIEFIKAHGALYNDCINRSDIFHTLCDAAQRYQLPLVAQAHPSLTKRCAENRLNCLFEAFADRAYNRDGTLVKRSQNNAILASVRTCLEQTKSIVEKSGLIHVEGEWLDIRADTLCIHSDSPCALESAQAIRHYLNELNQ